VRGMRGGHRRKTCLGKPPFGFTRKVLRDAAGQVVLHPASSPMHVWCWDPINQVHFIRIFEMFCVEMRSVAEIADYCNAERVGDWDGWLDGGIRKILRNPAYIGVF